MTGWPSIGRSAARELVSAAMKIKAAAAEQTSVQHPELPSLDHIAYVMFRERRADEPGVVRTCNCVLPGRADRSPCGTGSSAQLAVMRARGEIEPRQSLTTRSVIGSEFQVSLARDTTVGNKPAVIPRISGRAWIFGFHQIGVAPDDPFPLGYTLSDTWGERVDVTR